MEGVFKGANIQNQRQDIKLEKKHASDFTDNYKEIYKFIMVYYKHGRPKMYLAIKNMDKPTITVTKVPEDTARMVGIFIW